MELAEQVARCLQKEKPMQLTLLAVLVHTGLFSFIAYMSLLLTDLINNTGIKINYSPFWCVKH
jgi:hypothetical protein